MPKKAALKQKMASKENDKLKNRKKRDDSEGSDSDESISSEDIETIQQAVLLTQASLGHDNCSLISRP
jgi:hypothetical protein